jgi:hypothetical protein
MKKGCSGRKKKGYDWTFSKIFDDWLVQPASHQPASQQGPGWVGAMSKKMTQHCGKRLFLCSFSFRSGGWGDGHSRSAHFLRNPEHHIDLPPSTLFHPANFVNGSPLVLC